MLGGLPTPTVGDAEGEGAAEGEGDGALGRIVGDACADVRTLAVGWIETAADGVATVDDAGGVAVIVQSMASR